MTFQLKGQCPDYAHVRTSSVFSSKDNRTVILTRKDFLPDQALCVTRFDQSECVIPPRKVVGTLYLDSSCISFKYFAFLSVCDKFELLGHVQAAMMIWVLLLPFFLDSLLVPVSGFYRIISVNLLLQPFFFVKFGVYPGLPVLVSPLRGFESALSQPISTTPGKRVEKLAEAKADVKRATENPGRVCFILNQKR